MEFINYLGDENVAKFMLLFARVGGLFVFFPFFSHTNIPQVIKATLALFLTMFLLPLSTFQTPQINTFFILQILSEVLFGMIAGLMMTLIFTIIQFAGEQMAFTMGFTMASVMDPSTGASVPITSQILSLIALLVFCGLLVLWFSCIEGRFGWKPIPSIARVTRDVVSGLPIMKGELSGRQYLPPSEASASIRFLC